MHDLILWITTTIGTWFALRGLCFSLNYKTTPVEAQIAPWGISALFFIAAAIVLK